MDEDTPFDFDIDANDAPAQTISGFAGGFEADFKPRTDELGVNAQKMIMKILKEDLKNRKET